MTPYQRALARRRLELLERSAAQRAAIASSLGPVLATARKADHWIGVVKDARLGMAALSAGAALLGARGVLSWMTRATAIYSLLRRI